MGSGSIFMLASQVNTSHLENSELLRERTKHLDFTRALIYAFCLNSEAKEPMNQLRRSVQVFWLAIIPTLYLLSQSATAQQKQSLTGEMRALVETPAVPGYEQDLSARIA